MSEYDQILVNELIYKSLEGEISEEEYKILGDFVSKPENVPYYLKSLHLHEALRDWANLLPETSQTEADCFGLSELAVYERVAPAIEVTREEMQPELIQKVVYPKREKRKLSKFNLFSVIISTAAVLAVGLFIKFAPVKDMSQDMAAAEQEQPHDPYVTMVDSINTLWADASKPAGIGSRLSMDDGDRWLQGGYIKLLFGSGVEVVIESPAHFKIRSGHELEMLSGRAYSTVSEKGRGFIVYTPNAKVIDLGTEFGVEVLNGDSSVHMIKGKASLLPNTDLPAQKPIELVAGFAEKIGQNGNIQNIKLNDEIFVSDISSRRKMIYRADKAIKVGLWDTQLAPVLETDLRTDGRLVRAVNLGPAATTSATACGILFEPLSQAGGAIWKGTDSQAKDGVFYTGPDSGLTSLLTTSRDVSVLSTEMGIRLDGLKVGQAYRIQLILGFAQDWCDVNLYGAKGEHKYFANGNNPPIVGLATYRWEAASSSESVSFYLRAYENERPWNKVSVFGYVLHETDDSINGLEKESK